ncbi:MAG TPA: Tol-Pal system beta propeller repeat protein TolB [Gammaproteobacteria bacterium]|nr:Tol-Pal system beta propeller repeat protein TolB [Gammaproteobacteria bacterium]
MKRSPIALVLAILLLALARPAAAVLTIDITQGVRDPLPVALVPFSWEGEGEPPMVVSEVVAADLQRAGLFRLLDSEAFISRPHRPDEVQFKDFRLVGADALVIGRMTPAAENGVEVRFRLFDIYSQEQVAGVRYRVDAGGLRQVAHRIADTIHEKLVGWSGAFTSRLAYVVKAEERYRLMIADADGANPRSVLTSGEPLLSPAWAPDGNHLAYVSFEENRSMVYRQNLETGKRTTLAAFDGINSAPAFSPGGDKLALALSRDGNPEIYVLDLASRQLRRLTHHGAIDTEPTWGPQGERLIFTSDRGGGPQLYRMRADGGEPKRLTFEGNYNASPTWSPDGRWVAFLHGDGNRFQIAVKDLENKGPLRTVSGRGPHEAPSFAPNSHTILFATRAADGGGELATVSVDGNVQQRLQRQRAGDVREPAWSPMP